MGTEAREGGAAWVFRGTSSCRPWLSSLLRASSVVSRPGTFAVNSQVDSLVSASRAGDRSARDMLLAAILPLVVNYCRSRIGRHEHSYASADDVAQEVCLAVLTALPSYRPQGRPFLAFVYGIASHKVAEAHRSAARSRDEPVAEFPEFPELADNPEQQALDGERTGRMVRLMAMLPHKQREILILRIVVGLSAEETADAIGSTPGAVRVAQHRALVKLRKLLDA
jgi:RNA polymerase sigma-70 factor (ECF subfamily)